MLYIFYKYFVHYDISFYIRVFKNDSFFLMFKKITDPKRKTIHMIESDLPYLGGSKYNKWAKYNALHSDYVFSVSAHVKKAAQKLYGLNTEVIYVGADTTLFHPIDHNNQKLRIISCGTLNPNKGPDLFLNIAKDFPDQSFEWVGEGKLRDMLEQRIIDEDIENCKIRHNMPHSELSIFMGQSDIFLFPSIHEGFAKVIIEAMASGLPVIVFDLIHPEEIVIQGVSGFIVKSKDEMEEKLEVLCTNKELRNYLGNNAVRQAKKFDWDKIAKQWDSVIRSIV
jgi:glycosyltransferase involved in cell wall biosynthesis